LPRQLLATSVTIGGVASPLIAVANVNGSEQINFQVPWETAGHASAQVVVTSNGVSSQPVQVTVHAAQPGVFTVDGMNAVALHGAKNQPISAASPAAKGEVIVLYATGLGPVTNQPATGNPASGAALSKTTLTTSVSIGSKDAAVSFSGLTPGYVGLYQINLTVPSNVDSGVQDLVVTANGAASKTVKIAVQ
jgi:uncharacterized protein (TIGR03437 family)